MKCKAIKLDKTPCNAYATKSGDYCFRHTKTLKIQALKASSDGGKANREYHCLGNKMKIKTPSDIKKLMEKSINSLWTGKMPSNNPAGSLAYLAKIFLEAYDKNDLEVRIESLEQRLK